MATSTREVIKVGPLAIRFLVEGAESSRSWTPGILGPDYFLEGAAILDAASGGPA